MNLQILAIITTIITLISQNLYCQDLEFLYGSEFTFSNHEIGKHHLVNLRKTVREQNIAKKKLTVEVLKLCPQCKLRPHNVIMFPDSYWMKINTDPGVVETQARPATLQQYKAMKEHFQYLFDGASNVGLFPDTFMSGGHIHIGLKELGEDPIFIRNIIVDFTNHFELAEGILDLNQENSPSLRELEAEYGSYTKLKESIEAFDRGELTLAGRKISSASELIRFYYKIIQQSRFEAFNLQSAHDTIEIRSIRTQANFDEFLKETTLFEERLKYLKRLSDKKILVPVDDYVDSSELGTKKFDKLLVQKYYDYVTESGLDWGEYRSLIYLQDLKRKKIEQKETIKMCKAAFL